MHAMIGASACSPREWALVGSWMLNAFVLTALSHVGLPVLQALADELVYACFTPNAADLLRRADAAPWALRLPSGASCRTTHGTEYVYQRVAFYQRLRTGLVVLC